MYLIRNDDEEFIDLITNTELHTTKNINKAMVFDDLDKAKALLNYLQLEDEYTDWSIVEIKFGEVK